MPPKQRITREMIMERAFDMLCREGMDAVNARSVAKALNCSTQPIFSYYTGMQELRDTLDLKAQEMFAEQVLSIKQSETWPTDLGEAFVRFACAQPHVYKHLYESVCLDAARLEAIASIVQDLAAHIAQKEGVSEEQAKVICQNTIVYCVGLASVSMVNEAYAGDVRAKIEAAYRANLSAMA